MENIYKLFNYEKPNRKQVMAARFNHQTYYFMDLDELDENLPQESGVFNCSYYGDPYEYDWYSPTAEETYRFKRCS